jgi:hypothetical protein
MKDSAPPSPDLPGAYRRLRDQLQQVGWIALGSVLERGRPGQGGPRYQWSRRVGRKTVTVALSAEQFAWLKEAIANQRRVWDIWSTTIISPHPRCLTAECYRDFSS